MGASLFPSSLPLLSSVLFRINWGAASSLSPSSKTLVRDFLVWRSCSRQREGVGTRSLFLRRVSEEGKLTNEKVEDPSEVSVCN